MATETLHRPGIAQLTPLLRRLVGDEKHEPSGYSTLDIMWVLYDRVLRVEPRRLDDPDRDRFLVSKGHGPHAYYAVLAAKGFFPQAWLDDLAGPDSPLGHHPDRVLVPGVEISSGSLGHGLGLAVGTALGLRAQRRSLPRVYVLVGDGELDEGSNHEAIAYAGSTGLDSLTVIVVDNGSTRHPWRSGLAGQFTVNDWTATTVDATDHDRLEAALRGHQPGRPHVVIARAEGGL
jgi:transketolase